MFYCLCSFYQYWLTIFVFKLRLLCLNFLFDRSCSHSLDEVLGHEQIEDQHWQDGYAETGEKQTPVGTMLSEESAEAYG